MIESNLLSEDVSCVQCGYNLRGLQEFGRCPECNMEIAISYHSDFLQVSDVACLQCGYNLRGLSPTGNCPECNTEISKSHNSNLLRFSSPDWLRKVKFGFDLVLIGILGSFVVGLIIGVVGAAVSPGLLPVAALLVGVGAYAIHLWAVFSITAPEPRDTFTESGSSWRNRTRLFALLGIASFAYNQGIQFIGFNLFFSGVGLLAGGVLGIGLYYSGFTYVSQLAERIPNPKLVRSSGTLKWALIILTASSIVFSIFMMAMTNMAPGAVPATPPAAGAIPGTGFMIGTCFVGVLGLAILVLGLIMLIRFRKAFKVAVRQAEIIASGQALTSDTP